jgi:large subunit ribosomal protein L25
VSDVRLAAETRTEFGKGGARRTRRAGKVPAVIYGHGEDPRHISLPAREFTAAVRHGGVNVLLTLDIEGKEQLAIPKAIQRHPIKGTFDHVDLLAVRRGEKITVDVPIVVSGEVVAGALLAQEHTSLSVEAEATSVPAELEVNVEGLQIGTHITAGQVGLPRGVTLVTDADAVVLMIQEAPTELEVPEVEAAEGAETEAPAEGGESGAGEAAEGAEATAESAE